MEDAVRIEGRAATLTHPLSTPAPEKEPASATSRTRPLDRLKKGLLQKSDQGDFVDPANLPKKYVASDSETEGLEPETYIMTACGIDTPEGGIEVKHIESDDEEVELIRWIREKVSKYSTKVVIAWNAKFDFRFARTRALILGERDPLSKAVMFDDYQWFKNFTNTDSGSLDHVAKILEMGAKVGVGHQMPRLYHEGKYDEIVEHCRRDVELLINVHERILSAETGKKPTFIGENHPERDIPEVSV